VEGAVPLKIIGAGFGRTGTTSAYHAITQLGFPCYHMKEVVAPHNKGHMDFWRRVANGPEGAQHPWEQVFANYTATLDNPSCCVWQELMAAYPDAKVILTLHPKGPDAWYDSTIETIYFSENRWQFKVLQYTTPFGQKFGDVSHKLIWQRSHRGTMSDRGRAIAHYNQHIENVKAAVPPERLLIYSVDQGWKPLCTFLGVPVPAAPFPNVNDRAENRALVDGVLRAAYFIMAAGAIIAAAAIYGLVRLFS